MMTIRMNFSGVRSVIEPLRLVETRLPNVVTRLPRPSMVGNLGWSETIVCLEAASRARAGSMAR
jgi:hypothetical protein